VDRSPPLGGGRITAKKYRTPAERRPVVGATPSDRVISVPCGANVPDRATGTPAGPSTPPLRNALRPSPTHVRADGRSRDITRDHQTSDFGLPRDRAQCACTRASRIATGIRPPPDRQRWPGNDRGGEEEEKGSLPARQTSPTARRPSVSGDSARYVPRGRARNKQTKKTKKTPLRYATCVLFAVGSEDTKVRQRRARRKRRMSHCSISVGHACTAPCVCVCVFVCVCAAIFGQPATAVSLAGWVTTIHTLFSCCEANSSCNRERRSDLNRWLAQGISTADRLHAAWTHRDSLAARHPAPGTEALPKSTGCERKGCSPSLPELAATWDRPHAVHAANRRRKRRKKGKKKKEALRKRADVRCRTPLFADHASSACSRSATGSNPPPPPPPSRNSATAHARAFHRRTTLSQTRPRPRAPRHRHTDYAHASF